MKKIFSAMLIFLLMIGMLFENVSQVQAAEITDNDNHIVAAATKTTTQKDSPETGVVGLKALKKQLNKELSSQPGTYQIYVKNLDTNYYLTINDSQMTSGSLMKIFVMLDCYNEVKKGTLSEDSTFNKYMWDMITVSDNPSTNELTKLLGDGSFGTGAAHVNKYCKKNKYSGTKFVAEMGKCDPRNVTTAKDCGWALERMYRNTAVDAAYSKKMITTLKAQTRRNKIPAGVPAGTVVANKTGELTSVENDAAIVYSPGANYILVVMSKNGVNAISEIGNISKIVYDYFNDKVNWSTYKPVVKNKVSELKVGKRKKFKTNAPAGVRVKWSVSNKKLATITDKGVFTAKKIGKVKVTAKFITRVSGKLKTKKRTFKVRIRGKKVIFIDPGHQAKENVSQEPVGPGSTTTKMKVTGGCVGVSTGITEGQFNLTVGLKLRDALEKEGYEVVMSRTTMDVDISNVERAKMANECGADINFRIHADSFSNSSLRGVSILYPSTSNPYPIRNYASDSKKLAQYVLDEYVDATGLPNRGLYVRDDLSGTNWSKMPTVLIECGFFSNPTEDRLLNSDSMQKKMVKGIVSGINKYFGY